MILTIDLFAMVDIDDEDDQLVVLDIAENAIIADAVSPEVAKGCTFQCITDLPRVLQNRNPLLKKALDPLSHLTV
jgi:hypothetical protein